MLNHGIVAIIYQDKKFLLIKDSRPLMLNHWAPPHGCCENVDKTEEDCVIREVYEKAGLTVKPIKKIWTTKADTKVKTVSFWSVELVSGEVKIDQKSSEYGWFGIKDALTLKLYPGTKKFFNLIKNGKIKIQNIT